MERSAVKSPLFPSWLPLAGVLALAFGLLLAVVFGLAEDLTGWVKLPDTASGATVETLLDPARAFTIDDVATRPDTAWTSGAGKNYFGAERGVAVWLRVTLPNRTVKALHGVVGESGYYTDQVDFWLRDEGGPAASAGPFGTWRHERSGEWTRHRPVWGRGAVFVVDVPARATVTCYLRAEDHFAIWMGLSWWPSWEELLAVRWRVALSEGVYYGALFALFFYNAVLWIRLRFSDTGYYLGYLGASSTFIFSANGGFPQFITAVGSPVVEMIGLVALTLGAASLAQFGRVFLELGERLPRADRVARWLRNLLLLSLPIAVATLWLPSMKWSFVLLAADVVVHGTMLTMAVLAWRAGVAHARWFVLAFGFLIAGLSPLVLSFFARDLHRGLLVAFFTGSVMEMLVLSLAMADRFARMERERAAAQERLAEEMAQRETLQEAYADELEVEVGERTRELQEANRDKDRMIAVIGHDLRGPLTALTMGAELATARPDEAPGFAGEAAHTGRQVLLLIEDLVLWARLRAGGVHLGVHRVKDFVTQVAALHQPLAAQRGVTLEISVPESLRVTTDLVLAQTLVRNLVANAVRFARTRVVVGAVAVAEGVRLTVSDDGPGLPPEVGAALSAGEGERAREEPRAGGLGLRFCAEIGRALGLRLAVKTGEGRGAEFGFTLPGADSKTPFGEKIS